MTSKIAATHVYSLTTNVQEVAISEHVLPQPRNVSPTAGTAFKVIVIPLTTSPVAEVQLGPQLMAEGEETTVPAPPVFANRHCLQFTDHVGIDRRIIERVGVCYARGQSNRCGIGKGSGAGTCHNVRRKLKSSACSDG